MHRVLSPRPCRASWHLPKGAHCGAPTLEMPGRRTPENTASCQPCGLELFITYSHNLVQKDQNFAVFHFFFLKKKKTIGTLPARALTIRLWSLKSVPLHYCLRFRPLAQPGGKLGGGSIISYLFGSTAPTQDPRHSKSSVGKCCQ